MGVDEILNNIPTAEPEKKVTEITVIKKAPTQKTVNTILLVAAAFIFIAVIASYFVELNIFTDISLKELSTGAAWVFIGSYSIASIFKQIAINRAKQTQEYIDQKNKTAETLKKYADSGELTEVSAYCKAWEEKALIDDREKFLKPVGIPYAVFLEKYLAKGIIWLKKNCPELSVKQLIAVTQANAVRIQTYNADFLRTTVHTAVRRSPSARFDTDKKNAMHNLRTIIFMILGSCFAYSITQELILSFSIEAIISAGIKIAIIIISVAFATSFGWNLITVTEISKLKLQETEAEECVRWRNQHKGEKE